MSARNSGRVYREEEEAPPPVVSFAFHKGISVRPRRCVTMMHSSVLIDVMGVRDARILLRLCCPARTSLFA